MSNRRPTSLNKKNPIFDTLSNYMSGHVAAIFDIWKPRLKLKQFLTLALYKFIYLLTYLNAF